MMLHYYKQLPKPENLMGMFQNTKMIKISMGKVTFMKEKNRKIFQKLRGGTLQKLHKNVSRTIGSALIVPVVTM